MEICYNKTTHIIFSAEITYVDLENESLVAGLVDWAKNVLRVKSAFKSFKEETNLSVITDDGSYYTFNVKFAKEPLLLSIEMTDFFHDGDAVNCPNSAQEVYLEKLGQESPMLVKLIMKFQTYKPYGGISVLAGYETVNWGKDKLSDGSTLHDSDTFIYGGALNLQAESYLSDKIALAANVKGRFTFGSDVQIYHTTYGLQW